jgi:hypothetical protein
MITIFNSEYAPKVIRLEDEKRYAHEQSRGSSAMLRIDKADQEVIREKILEGRVEGGGAWQRELR